MIEVMLNAHRDLVEMIEDKYRGAEIYKATVTEITISGNLATVNVNLDVYSTWLVECTFRVELSESRRECPVVTKLREIIMTYKAPEETVQIEIEQEDQAQEVLELQSEEELRKELRSRIADLTPGYRWHVIARDERESVELAFLRIDAHDVAEVFSNDAITSMLYSLSRGRQLEAERTMEWLNANDLWTGGKMQFAPEERGRAEHGGVERNNRESQ